jgi:hypothetical protein
LDFGLYFGLGLFVEKLIQQIDRVVQVVVSGGSCLGKVCCVF